MGKVTLTGEREKKRLCRHLVFQNNRKGREQTQHQRIEIIVQNREQKRNAPL